jgi:hypothetical protein
MSKVLTFTLGGKSFSLAPEKIDRKKIYGWQEKLVFDDDGKECTLAYTDDTGTLVMPKGGVGLGIVSPEGEWVERSSLKAQTLDGDDAALIPSSYDVPNALSKKVNSEEFLDYTITAVYQLGEDTAFCAALGDDIYTFEYIYRDGYETTTAFVLQSNGAAFMLLGYETGIEMLDLNQTAEIDAEDENPDEDEEVIDFTMM